VDHRLRELEPLIKEHAQAEWLVATRVIAAGADTESLECQPFGIYGRPQPVHVALLVEAGIHILEMLDRERLAADRRYEFLFVCTPLKLQRATGFDGPAYGDRPKRCAGPTMP
jgi:kynurenine formamidase